MLKNSALPHEELYHDQLYMVLVIQAQVLRCYSPHTFPAEPSPHIGISLIVDYGSGHFIPFGPVFSCHDVIKLSELDGVFMPGSHSHMTSLHLTATASHTHTSIQSYCSSSSLPLSQIPPPPKLSP